MQLLMEFAKASAALLARVADMSVETRGERIRRCRPRFEVHGARTSFWSNTRIAQGTHVEASHIPKMLTLPTDSLPDASPSQRRHETKVRAVGGRGGSAVTMR